MALALALPANGRTATPADGLYEVVRGVRVEKPAVGARATAITGYILCRLHPFVHGGGLGHVVMEMLFILHDDPELKRRPDVAFVPADRWAMNRAIPEGDWPVAPAIAVEVASPHNTERVVVDKEREYFAHGVSEVWQVSPDREEVIVRPAAGPPRLFRGSDVFASAMLPGFNPTTADFFRPWP